jgi:thiamine-monophosphate kinase
LALVATTDAVREGAHFTAAFSPQDIGHKALAVNLSDLAAMGAKPRWFLVALEIPSGLGEGRLEGVARGMAILARQHGCLLVGGNVIRGDRLGLTVTALGEVAERLALRRDALRPGDLVAVTGSLGAAALGLERLRAGRRQGTTSQRRPTPRVLAGQAALGIARAAIDLSDGLATDLGHLAQSSGVRIDLEAARLPIAPQASLAMALTGGEDYELAFGVSPRRFGLLQRRLARLGLPLTVVGDARRGRGLWLNRALLRSQGFDHLRSGGPVGLTHLLRFPV